MKKVIMTATTFVALFALSGCGNKDLIDTHYTFDKAICKFPGEEVKEFEIKKWTDYEDGEQIQFTDKDGNTYLASSNYCVLVSE